MPPQMQPLTKAPADKPPHINRGFTGSRFIAFCAISVALVSLIIGALSPVSANNQNEGCFDQRRFCFEVVPSQGQPLPFQVQVKRQVALPVALTLYSDALYRQSSSAQKPAPIAHANAYLDSNDTVVLGLVDNPRTFWRSMRVKWTVGVLNAKHNDDTIYAPPLQPLDQYRIVQGFNGGFSHRGRSRYALDFAAPVGTPILAARSGIVIDTKDDGKKGGASSRFAKYANFVVILHDDGTTGEYYHLKYKGVAVTRGQTVQQGQLIGYTGNTGFSSLPHLHFGIYYAQYHGGYQSVPFKLSDQ